MRSWSTIKVAVATGGALLAGLVAGRMLPGAAHAQEPGPGEASPAGCRVFAVDLAPSGFDIDLADRTTEIGRWARERADEGGVVTGVDFEVGQKSTGYPQGWVQVCTTSR